MGGSMFGMCLFGRSLSLCLRRMTCRIRNYDASLPRQVRWRRKSGGSPNVNSLPTLTPFRVQSRPLLNECSAASHVRPHGLIAFHEVAAYGACPALPPVPLWEQSWNLVITAFRSVMVHPDAAGRMTAYFHDAGLKRPTIFCETPVGGGPDSPLYGWLGCTLRSVLP